MRRSWVFVALRSILVGWAALLALTYIIERPLLLWAAHLLGDHWTATAKLSLDCLMLAATGWLVGRLNRSMSRAAPLFGVLVFACNTWLLRNLNPFCSGSTLRCSSGWPETLSTIVAT